MLRRRLSLILILAAYSSCAEANEPRELLESFDEKFNLDWDIIRDQPDSRSLEANPGELTINTLPGTIYSKLERDHFQILKNLFLLNEPVSSDTDFVATLHVTRFEPISEDQEVALVLYQSDNSYFKLAAKCGDDDKTTSLRAVAEFNGGCSPWFEEKQELDGPFWLRLTRRDKKYAIHFSDDGDQFRRLRGVGFKPVNPDQPLRVGFYATNGSEGVPPTSKSIDITIESFSLLMP